MKKLLAIAAMVFSLALSGVASGANDARLNVEPGGGAFVTAFYIARVYTFYDGYWHWINCEYVLYSDGSALQTRCW